MTKKVRKLSKGKMGMTDEEKDKLRRQQECKRDNCFTTCGVDQEIKELCHALNCIPGIKTFESCCGHGNDPIRIWFRTENIESLKEIAQFTDKRYAKDSDDDFTCVVEFSDRTMLPVFCLQSKGVGENSYKNGRALAKSISLKCFGKIK
ncbi:MAG: hypothetical protein PHW73_04175 [Atribacterota bacterium]|nr:hypothetical protein [Atribacterota bacterium]